MKLPRLYTARDIKAGLLIYPLGDLIGTLIAGNPSLTRTLGMMFIGGFLYALEIPAYFRFLEKKLPLPKSVPKKLLKALWACLFFNPLWVWRHLAFTRLFQGDFAAFSLFHFHNAAISFLWAFPMALLANYFIQNKAALSWRFALSATFSAFMACYFAIMVDYV